MAENVMSNAHLLKCLIFFVACWSNGSVCLHWNHTVLTWKAQTGNWVHVSQRQQEQILNLAQDISHSVGCIPTSKHISTALHILEETRSKTTLTLLNSWQLYQIPRCQKVHYNYGKRYIATMAKSVNEQNGVFIPTHLKPGRFTQFAFDNLDFQE